MNINVGADGNILPSGQRASSYVFTHILPYMEQQPLYSAYNVKMDFRRADNSTAVSTLIPTLLCPSSANGDKYFTFSDAAGDSVSTGGPYTNVKTAITDYAVSNGIADTLAPTGWVDLTTDAQYAMLKNVTGGEPDNITRISQVTDGLSNTIMMSESAGRPNIYVGGNKRLATVPGEGSAGGWADYDTGYTLHSYTYDGSKTPGPCFTGCYNGNEDYSFHPGGGNYLMGDGSVRFLKSTTSLRIYVRLLTRDMGEIVSADQY